MTAKILRVISVIVAVVIATAICYSQEFLAQPINYSSFMAKIKANEASTIEIDPRGNKAFIFEKDSNKIYETTMTSFDEIEQILANNETITSEYVIENSVGVFAFVVICTIYSLLFNACIIGIYYLISDKFKFKNRIEDDKKKKKKRKEEEEEKKQKRIEEYLKKINGDDDEIEVSPVDEKTKKTCFANVIGLDRQIEELNDIVSFLKEPEVYRKMGAEIPKGVLLYGEPGTGKTLIARAIAGEANVPFFSISASGIMSKWLGESEKNIRKIFKEAQKKAPAIIFIDELDSIAVQRYSENSNKYSTSVLNQLLACMDGFETSSGVIVIAATNYKDVLDDAVLRRGRFDRQIYIQKPDKEARKKLIEYYMSGKTFSNDFVSETFASMTVGMTGSDIRTIINEAIILAVRHGNNIVTEDNVYEAYRKVIFGVKNTKINENLENAKNTAIHEAGHAIVSRILGNTPLELSIISRGNAGGYNLFEDDEKAYYTADEMLNEVKIALGGRAAEKIIFDKVSSGASSDLRKSSEILRHMHLVYGMGKDKEVGLVLVNNGGYNDCITKNSIDYLETELKECFDEALRIVRQNEYALKKLADLLCEKETLNKEEIEEFFTKLGI